MFLPNRPALAAGPLATSAPHILYSLIHMGVHHECQTQTILFLIEHSQMMTAKTKLVSHGTVVVLHVAWPHRIFNCISFKILLHLAHRAFAPLSNASFTGIVYICSAIDPPVCDSVSFCHTAYVTLKIIYRYYTIAWRNL